MAGRSLPSEPEGYKIGKVIPADQIPTTSVRKNRYAPIVRQLTQLKPGDALPVYFPTSKDAERARTTIRDRLAAKYGPKSFITFTQKESDGGVTVFFVRTLGKPPLSDTAE